jgi:hypothetical protein
VEGAEVYGRGLPVAGGAGTGVTPIEGVAPSGALPLGSGVEVGVEVAPSEWGAVGDAVGCAVAVGCGVAVGVGSGVGVGDSVGVVVCRLAGALLELATGSGRTRK